jgi:hypothetical protein
VGYDGLNSLFRTMLLEIAVLLVVEAGVDYE